jgi:hypothetical protein
MLLSVDFRFFAAVEEEGWLRDLSSPKPTHTDFERITVKITAFGWMIIG